MKSIVRNIKCLSLQLFVDPRRVNFLFLITGQQTEVEFVKKRRNGGGTVSLYFVIFKSVVKKI